MFMVKAYLGTLETSKVEGLATVINPKQPGIFCFITF